MESGAVHRCTVIFLTRQDHRTAPDLHGPIFVWKWVLEGDAGEAVMAALSRFKCAMYLLKNRERERAKAEGNPQGR